MGAAVAAAWAGQDGNVTTIVRMAAGADVEEVLSGITAELAAQGVQGTPTSVQQIAASIQGVLGMIATVPASIVAVALVVEGVGMMDTMYTSVLERTCEIGVLKAIGALSGAWPAWRASRLNPVEALAAE